MKNLSKLKTSQYKTKSVQMQSFTSILAFFPLDTLIKSPGRDSRCHSPAEENRHCRGKHQAKRTLHCIPKESHPVGGSLTHQTIGYRPTEDIFRPSTLSRPQPGSAERLRGSRKRYKPETVCPGYQSSNASSHEDGEWIE